MEESSAAADPAAKGARGLPKAALETAREIELVAELELRGDFLDRVPALVQQRRGAVDAGIEMKPARRKTNRTSEFLPERLV